MPSPGPDKDYVSPGLSVVWPDVHFPRMRVGDRTDFRLLRDAVNGEPGDWRPSVCIVSGEVIGPVKNGGIGTAMTGLAEHLARSGCSLTILYTGGVWAPDIHLGKWKTRYAELGIDFVALSLGEMTSVEGPLVDRGFGTPYLVYQHLAAKHFDVVHFNDCVGDGSVCLVAKSSAWPFKTHCWSSRYTAPHDGCWS